MTSIAVSQMKWIRSPVLNNHRGCNTTGATSEAETADPSGAPEYTHGFKFRFWCSVFSFLCSILSFYFRTLYCLSSFDARILIIPLVSSNISLFRV
jgi:hypothetical protein